MRELSEGLHRALREDRLGHALLFAVSDGARVPALVADFARALMCLARDGQGRACGRCESCEVFGEGRELENLAHPDFLFLRAASDVGGYSVDQIRALSERFALGRALGQERVACLLEADRLSVGAGAAGHAFLKLLEEPRPNSRFLLLSSRLEGLSATLRSRVQILRSPALLDAAPVAVDSEDSGQAEWLPLEEWICRGAPPGENCRTPGDDEAYWKERGQAVTELKSLVARAWQKSRGQAFRESLPLDAQRRVLFVFERLESCLRSIEGYGNGPLQWLAFRSDVRLKL